MEGEGGGGDVTILGEEMQNAEKNDENIKEDPTIKSFPSEEMTPSPKETESATKVPSKQMSTTKEPSKEISETKKLVEKTLSSRTIKQISISTSVEMASIESKRSLSKKTGDSTSLNDMKTPSSEHNLEQRHAESLGSTGKSNRPSVTKSKGGTSSVASFRSRISKQSVESKSPRMSILTTPEAEAMQTLLIPTARMSVAQPGQKIPLMFGRRGERSSRIAPMSTSLLSFQPSSMGLEKIKVPKYMNTYRLESKNPFNVDWVNAMIRNIIDKELENVKYDPIQCAKLCMSLSAELRLKVKEIGFDRYKLVCVVEIVERKLQSLFSGMRVLWDADRDRYATYSFHNSYIYAVATIYGIYYE